MNTPEGIDATLLDSQQRALAARLRAAADADVVARLWARDDTLWGPAGQAEVADRLGWLTILDTIEPALDDLEAFAAAVRDEQIADVVLLGMGGSSLAPEVIRLSFGEQPGWPRLHVLDSTDAGAIRAIAERIDLDASLFLVSTKSGGTIETLSLFKHFWSLRPDGARFVAITDPGSGLEALAAEHGFRRTFLNDPDIGGRYSALSFFGLVPAALMGADVRGLVTAGREAERACREPSQANPGLWLGLAVGELAGQGQDKLTFAVDAPLDSFGLWVEQLVAESTGKGGRGALPVAGEPLGAPGAYGNDRTFVHLRAGGAGPAALGALAGAGHPVIVIATAGPADLGRIFFLWEFAVAVSGWVLRLNVFDQPNVQEAKDATTRVLDEDRPEPTDADDEGLRALLRGLTAPGYLAVMGYLAPSPAFDAKVTEMRTAIRDATRATTTFGYGPRFLHSTGQFHKGGPGTGRFLQLVHDSAPDVEIPDASFGFTTLKHAQATGDLQTLRDHGLAAERVTLVGEDPAVALGALTRRLRGLLG